VPTQRSKMSRIERSAWENVGVMVVGFGEVPEWGGPELWVILRSAEEGRKEAGRMVGDQGSRTRMPRDDG
jgi:hypothetical protein